MNEKEIEIKALEFAKKNKKIIAQELTDQKIYKAEKNPISIFMAGSPGAGKTEFSKNLIDILKRRVIRIDGDEIRNRLPGYTGSNSYLFQRAISVIVEKIHDMALAQKQTFILDGTFSKIEKAIYNVERSLNKKRIVLIFYIYQKPEVAWFFTQKREIVEGRNIPKEKLIEQFLGARETVSKIRKKFGPEVIIFLVKMVEITKDASIDEYIKGIYNENQLKDLL